MFNGGSNMMMPAAPTLSDIAAVTNGGNGGFGGNNGAWWIILLFALFGWGRGGWGGYGGYSDQMSGSAPNYVLQTDFATIERKLDGITNGFSSLGYDQLAQINGVNTNLAAGFAGVNNAVCTLGFQTAQEAAGINANMAGYANTASVTAMQNQNALQAQISQCCCDNKQAIAQMKYDMATGNNSIMQAINQAAQNIMLNDNANYRQLHDENVAAAMAAKDAEIANLRSAADKSETRAMIADQTQYLRSMLRPDINPCYPVNNPYTTAYSSGNCCGQGCC